MALGGGKLIQSVTLQEQVTSRCADISLPEEPRQGTAFNERERLLQWAETVCSDHAAFATFLHGTFSHISDRERSLSPAHFLGGHVGLRRKIADCVGVVAGRKLRTVRGIVEPLTKALADACERGATTQPRQSPDLPKFRFD